MKEKQNPSFIRIGNDLVYTKTISLLDALCGMDLSIKHMDNRILFVKTSEVIQPDSIYKIEGEGMNTESNLYIKFKVVLPNKLSEERKKYIKKLIQTPDIPDSNINNNEDNKHFKFLDKLTESEIEIVNKEILKLSIKNKPYESEAESNNEYEEGVPSCNQQ